MRRYYRVWAVKSPALNILPYEMHEDIYANSEKGAERAFKRYHKGDQTATYKVERVQEIAKADFKGHHKIVEATATIW